MNVLIIGGTGVISTAVVQELLKNNVSITIINRGNQVIPENVELIKSDKNDYETISLKLNGRKFNAICDFLCYTPNEIKKSFCFYQNYTSQYIFISSCAVYDTRCNGICTEDSKKVLPVWDYSVKKWEAEEWLRSEAKKTKTFYTIVRPSITYGNTRIPYGISPRYGYHWTLCARILAGKPIITWNNGQNRNNMMRVEDFAKGFFSLLGNPMAYNTEFNICGDETPTYLEVLKTLEKYLNTKVKTIDIPLDFYASQQPSKKGEILGGRSFDSINSNQKLKQINTGFKQEICLEEGIKMTLDAYKTSNFFSGIDWEYDGDCDRIIAKWIKYSKITDCEYTYGFVDYFNNATKKEKKLYYRSFYKDCFWVKIDIMIRKIIKRILRIKKSKLR